MLIDFTREDNSVISFSEVAEAPPIEPGRMRVYEHLLCIVKPTYDAHTGEGMPNGYDPATGQTQDTPADKEGKGHTILYDKSWFDYMARIMTPQAYHLWTNISGQNFNPGGWPNKGENISFPGNFYGLDYIGPTHARIICRNSLKAPSGLNPLYDNWLHDPTNFHMSVMVNNKGDVKLMGSGLYVYTPVVKRVPERYIPLSKIELFPALPFDVIYEGYLETVTGYCVWGTSVFGHTLTRDIPLRLVGQDRVAVHPCEAQRRRAIDGIRTQYPDIEIDVLQAYAKKTAFASPSCWAMPYA